MVSAMYSPPSPRTTSHAYFLQIVTTCCTQKRTKRTRYYFMQNCDYQQVADNSCIYVNKIMHEVDELTQIVADVAQDPTLPRTEDHQCPKCGHREAVFFQSQTTKAEDAMRLYYVCTAPNCGHRWTE
ncbi:DNA-directed RNA polymerase II subunit RPB9 isoform X1 [Branchiostoma floridae x Branchiostoma belcheri]